jgi:hypothetical protein
MRRMKIPTWLLAVLAVVALVAWWALRPGGGERVAADLIEQFPSATDKRPNPDVFSIVDATIGGDTRKAILVKDPSRLVYTATVPDDGQLRVAVALQEEAWTIEGDGVLFRVLVGAGGPPEEILNLHLNPYGNASDRRWNDLTLDLSEYAGETVELYFNTNSSLPVRPPRDDRNGDLALWGAPRIVAP